MDDLKLYAKNEQQLQNMVETVLSFTSDIGMSFGLEKCKKGASCKKGKKG